MNRLYDDEAEQRQLLYEIIIHRHGEDEAELRQLINLHTFVERYFGRNRHC
jgi:hypothetical protein